METTCGFFIVNSDTKILIVPPTNAKDTVWSIPKGRVNKGETELQAAYREVREETNINLKKYTATSIIALGTSKYKKRRKILSGFVFEYDGKFKEKLFCESMVKGKFPEVDRFQWVSFKKAFELIHHTQQELLEKYLKNHR